MATNTQTSIIKRSIGPDNDDLSVPVAEYFLSLGLCPDDVNRVSELSKRSSIGGLTEEEQSEIEEYNRVGDFISLLQAKARRAMRRAGRLPT